LEVWEGSYSELWGVKSLSSSMFFVWRLFKQKVATEVSLQSTDIVMCCESVESVEHLFFLCKVAQKIWHLCENWASMSNVIYKNPNYQLQSFWFKPFI